MPFHHAYGREVQPLRLSSNMSRTRNPMGFQCPTGIEGRNGRDDRSEEGACNGIEEIAGLVGYPRHIRRGIPCMATGARRFRPTLLHYPCAFTPLVSRGPLKPNSYG